MKSSYLPDKVFYDLVYEAGDTPEDLWVARWSHWPRYKVHIPGDGETRELDLYQAKDLYFQLGEAILALEARLEYNTGTVAAPASVTSTR